MTPELRARMSEAAVAAASAVGYVNAGTVEFLLEPRRIVLLPRDEHAPPGGAPGDRRGVGTRPRRAPARGRRGRAPPGRPPVGARRARDRGARLRRGPRERVPPAGRDGPRLRGARGPGIRVDSGNRGRERGLGPLRPDAREGRRAGPDARGGAAAARRRPRPDGRPGRRDERLLAPAAPRDGGVHPRRPRHVAPLPPGASRPRPSRRSSVLAAAARVLSGGDGRGTAPATRPTFPDPFAGGAFRVLG